MKEALVFEAKRDGYSIDQIRPMTVGELKNILDNYDDDTLFVLSHDRGYTYGSIKEDDVKLYRQNSEDEDFDLVW